MLACNCLLRSAVPAGPASLQLSFNVTAADQVCISACICRPPRASRTRFKYFYEK
ncbi:hypothetical protein [Methanimicrococcus hongohii]|uniref:hypothetical protein n=1 Tax=Methanimicrococcus hongohii TaxID=3028295 RepID=UPI002931C17D|nr:hypothetical protein [Methanimicrococcus sp. Hf6]